MDETPNNLTNQPKTEVRYKALRSSLPPMAPVATSSSPITFVGMTGNIANSVEAAAVELLTREEGALRRIIQRYVRDASTVDDVFQEVSLKVLRRIDSVRDLAAVRGWLFQLARNACLD